MKDVLSEIEKYKLLPVVTLHDEEEAVKVLGVYHIQLSHI